MMDEFSQKEPGTGTEDVSVIFYVGLEGERRGIEHEIRP